MAEGPEAAGPPATPEGALAALAMAVLALVTMANVVARYATNASIAFTEEYSVAIMVVLVFLGTAGAFATGRHLRVTFLVERLPRRAARSAEAAVLLVSAALFGAIAWLGALYTWDEYRFESLSPGLGVPQWLYTVWMPLLSLLILARIAGRLRRALRA